MGAQAWRDLENAMEIAVKVQAEGRTISNHGDFVDKVLSRVAALPADGDYATASDSIDAALADAADAHLRRQTRLMDSGIKMALLDGNAVRAALLLIRKSDADAGGKANLSDLLKLHDHYADQNQVRGIALEGRIAISLAQAIVPRAESADDRYVLLNRIGAAQQVLGERLHDTKLLYSSVESYKTVIQEYPQQEALPGSLGMIYVNLGNALDSLGAVQGNKAVLEEAVASYERALDVFRRQEHSEDWAFTQMNLCAALGNLAKFQSSKSLLKDSIRAANGALEVWTQAKTPHEWAMTHMNLGNSLSALGKKEGGLIRLKRAVESYKKALVTWEKETKPADWENTQNNLGGTLVLLTIREKSSERMYAAIMACQSAIEYWAEHDELLSIAKAQMGLGNANRVLGESKNSTDHLNKAKTAYENALYHLTHDRAPVDWAMIQFNLGDLSMAYFDVTKDKSHIADARSYMSAAHKIYLKIGAHKLAITARDRLDQIAATDKTQITDLTY